LFVCFSRQKKPTSTKKSARLGSTSSLAHKASRKRANCSSSSWVRVSTGYHPVCTANNGPDLVAGALEAGVCGFDQFLHGAVCADVWDERLGESAEKVRVEAQHFAHHAWRELGVAGVRAC
jgi:hypothetical protein